MIRTHFEFELWSGQLREMREVLADLEAGRSGPADPGVRASLIRSTKLSIESTAQKVAEYEARGGPPRMPDKTPVQPPVDENPILKFGKYGGFRLNEIKDWSYLNWLHEQPWLKRDIKDAIGKRLEQAQKKLFDQEAA